MNIYRILICSLLSVLFFSCDKKEDTDLFKINITSPHKKIKSGDNLQLSIATKKNNIDSVRYLFADKLLKTGNQENPVELSLTTPLGNQYLTAEIFRKGKKHTIKRKIILHAEKRPEIYTYKIIASHPHDIRAFTQGLEFYKDTLYEGTGHYGASSLRKIDLKSGKILKQINLDRQYFGEGITVMNDKIYQLTWQEGVGFVYDVHSFEKIQTFEYDKSPEGWGLCNDGEVIYKSDGTHKIWILDPETLEEKHYIEPVTHNALANQVNEMEFIDGKIYANTWQRDGVLIIDPKTGAVEGLVDFRGLKKELNQPDKAEVFNGIAYNKKTGKIYVTGKNWDKIFEVEIIEK